MVGSRALQRGRGAVAPCPPVRAEALNYERFPFRVRFYNSRFMERENLWLRLRRTVKRVVFSDKYRIAFHRSAATPGAGKSWKKILSTSRFPVVKNPPSDRFRGRFLRE